MWSGLAQRPYYTDRTLSSSGVHDSEVMRLMRVRARHSGAAENQMSTGTFIWPGSLLTH